jgi:mRNA interferase RelE/StbE
MRKTYAKKAVKDIKKINNPTKQRIKKGIEDLPNGDVKKLTGHDNLYRLRIGNWRVVFSYADNKTILVEDIEPRGGVYK